MRPSLASQQLVSRINALAVPFAAGDGFRQGMPRYRWSVEEGKASDSVRGKKRP